MNNREIDRIISEEIHRYELINEDANSDVGKLIGAFLKKKKKKEAKKNRKKNKKKKDIRKKKVVGGTVDYDYGDYLYKNRKVEKADYDKIIAMIDQDLTDIAAVAKIVFPNHTDEGAQSQLRKILNGERPMTSRVANILRKMISRGQIAVK